MITLEVCMDIFALHRQGLSVRSIARKLGRHRNTVTRYLERGELPAYTKGQRQGSILDPYKQLIEDLLDEEAYQATWLFDRIRPLGYPGGYDPVRHYVQGMKAEKRRLAYIRFETAPGRQAQMDWGEFQVETAQGGPQRFFLFVVLLGYSRAMYAELVPRCPLETFLDAHIRAFQDLGGVPQEMLYDNMKHVVMTRRGGQVTLKTEWLYFAHHYGGTPEVCPPYSPWVKGKVERPMPSIRERFWRGYAFDSGARANRDLLTGLHEPANQRIHGTHRQPVPQRWQEEQAQLGTRPQVEYATSIKVVRKVYKDCQVSYNGNRYVVPHHVVGKNILLKMKAGTIRVYDDQELLVTYQESQKKGSTIGQPGLYEKLVAGSCPTSPEVSAEPGERQSHARVEDRQPLSAGGLSAAGGL